MKVPEVDRNGITNYIETCFHENFTSGCNVTAIGNTLSCLTNIETFDNTMNFTFYSVPKTKTIVFGDLKVNISFSSPDSCEYLNVDYIGKLVFGNRTVAQMKYFRTKQEINDSYIDNFLWDPDNEYRYYKYDGPQDQLLSDEEMGISKLKMNREETDYNDNFESYHLGNALDIITHKKNGKLNSQNVDGDLLDVVDEWKTGYKRCDMTGSLRPNPVELGENGDCE